MTKQGFKFRGAEAALKTPEDELNPNLLRKSEYDELITRIFSWALKLQTIFLPMRTRIRLMFNYTLVMTREEDGTVDREKFGDWIDLTVRTCLKTGIFGCLLCSVQFSNGYELIHHLDAHFEDPTRWIKCHFPGAHCSENFNSTSAALAHLVTEHGRAEFFEIFQEGYEKRCSRIGKKN